MSLRALLVGAGLMGRWHAQAIHRAGSVLVGVADPDRAAAIALARGAPVFDAWEGALRALRPDVVHVCAPRSLHAPVVTAALRAGSHVIVEKPLALDLATTDVLLALATAQNLTLTPVHQLAAQGFVSQITAVGPVRLLRHELWTFGGATLNPEARRDLLADLLCHALSLCVITFGAEATMNSRAQAVRRGDGALHLLSAVGEGVFECALGLDGAPSRNELTITGQAATLHADLFHGFHRIERGLPGRLGKIARPIQGAVTALGTASGNLVRRAAQRAPAFPGLMELVGSAHAAARGAGASPFSPAHIRAVAAARDRVLASLDPRSAP